MRQLEAVLIRADKIAKFYLNEIEVEKSCSIFFGISNLVVVFVQKSHFRLHFPVEQLLRRVALENQINFCA